MNLADALLTIALFILGSFGAILAYVYKNDRKADGEANAKQTGDIQEIDRRLRALETTGAQVLEKLRGMEERFLTHEKDDEKAFDKMDRKLDAIDLDIKALARDFRDLAVSMRRSITPPGGTSRG